MEVRAEVQIQAARAAVWEKFLDISQWPLWHEQIGSVEWSAGLPWTEGAELRLLVSPLFVAVPVKAHVRMISERRMIVWESHSRGLTAVHAFEFSDSLGGCLLQERETYHGPAAAVFTLLQGRQSRAFSRSLHNFKSLAEGNRAREI